MKIKLYGTGSITSKSFNACAIVDEAILFDCPSGTQKRLLQEGVNFDKINTILISHFHADHDFDIPLMMFQMMMRTQPVTIIGPKGSKRRYKQMCEMSGFVMGGDVPVLERANPTIIEVTDGEKIVHDGYTITPYRMKHDNETMEAYGYNITKGGKTVGFSGDTTFCDGVEQLIKGASIAFLDVTGPPPLGVEPVYHMDIPEFEQLKSKYPKCLLVPIHMNDDTRKKLGKLGHKPPQDNKEYKI